TQATKDIGKGTWYPNWSPDGTRFAFPDGVTSYIYTIGKTPEQGRAEALPALPESGWFQVWGWSPDGKLLAGSPVVRRRNVGGFTYPLETKTYGKVSESGNNPVFLPDGKRLLYLDDGVLKIVDLAGKRVRPVAGAAALGRVADFALSKDGRFLFSIENKLEADIWQATLK